MKRILVLVLALAVSSIGAHAAETPTTADIEKCLRTLWEKKGDRYNPPVTVEINQVKIGAGAKANDQDVVDGIPPGTWVAAALVDFTVWTHEPKVTRGLRRVRQCKVYKDQFDDWQVMTGQPRGEDQRIEKPVDK